MGLVLAQICSVELQAHTMTNSRGTIMLLYLVKHGKNQLCFEVVQEFEGLKWVFQLLCSKNINVVLVEACSKQFLIIIHECYSQAS